MADRLHLVEGAEALRAALTATLAGGPPLAPLPPERAERDPVLAMLRPEEPVTEPDAAVVVATSGSTGAPKGVVLSRSAIRAAATATHERLGGPGDWVLALPPHYVAGLMVVARTIVAGSDLIMTSTVADLPEPTARSYLAVVPTQLTRMMADPAVHARIAGYAGVLVGGAPADPDLLDRARSAGIRVVTTYGMSETCGGCVYDGRPLSGVSAAIEEDGRISLGGAPLFSGYRLRPDLTGAAVREGRFLTSDRGHWDGDRLVVDGRVDDVIISGGMNVDLAAVERAARTRTHAELAIIGVPDREWGTAVVAVTEGPETVAELRAVLVDDLPSYALPRRVIRMTSLPRTSSGKIDRQHLLRTVTGEG